MLLRTLDNVTLEVVHKYQAYITIQPKKGNNDYEIKLEFHNLNEDETVQLHQLYKLSKALEFTSDLVKQKNYDISHIVVTGMAAKAYSQNNIETIWNCLSDEVGQSLIIE
jgi:hypothetical protein